MKKALHFGAGNIGRGFIGEMLHRNDFATCFVDVNQAMIDDLNKNNKYKIYRIDENKSSVEITNVSALHAGDTAGIIEYAMNADLITTSVGVENLGRIAEVLAQALTKRAKETQKIIDVIANENAINATNMLKEEIFKHLSDSDKALVEQYTGFVNSAIDRVSLSEEENGLPVPLVEPYCEWVMNETEIKNHDLGKFKDVVYVSEMLQAISRKLYLVNGSHAAAAYLGYLHGKETVQDALKDQKIYDLIFNLMQESIDGLVGEYNMDKQYLNDFAQKTLGRHTNPMMSDEVNRVGRSPIRKIGANERIVGSLLSLNKQGKPTTYAEKVLATALYYNDSTDEESQEIQQSIQNVGISGTLKKYSGINDDAVLARVETIYNAIKADKNSIF